MSNLQFQSVVKEGIEFYVSGDGNQSGMSIRGLALSSGVHHKTLTGLLNGVAAGTTTIESLKPFKDKVFLDVSVAGSAHNTKVVSSVVCAKVITYYAFQSKSAKNDKAKDTLSKFAAIGIDNWIKEISGYDIGDEKILNKLSLIYDQLQELNEFKTLAASYIKVKDGVKTTFPGLDEIIESIEEDLVPKLLPGSKVTLSDWVRSKRINLNNGGYCAFGRMVSECYKTMKRQEPKKGNRKKSNGKWSMNVRLYSEEDYPILESALKQYMSTAV